VSLKTDNRPPQRRTSREPYYYRRRKEYVGIQVSQFKKLKDLEGENAHLKKLVA
jgi:hypothetical protein